METLNTKLEAAHAAFAAAKIAYSRAALASQEGGSDAALHDAAEELRTAQALVDQLTAACDAAEMREQDRQRQQAAAAERAHATSINEALRDVHEAAELWDAALDGVARASRRYLEAADTVRRTGAGIEVLRKLDWAGNAVQLIIEHKLTPLLPRSAPFFTDEMAQLTHHLPPKVEA
jgi:hypothetical protein